jgi:hypothetical protein
MRTINKAISVLVLGFSSLVIGNTAQADLLATVYTENHPGGSAHYVHYRDGYIYYAPRYRHRDYNHHHKGHHRHYKKHKHYRNNGNYGYRNHGYSDYNYGHGHQSGRDHKSREYSKRGHTAHAGRNVY